MKKAIDIVGQLKQMRLDIFEISGEDDIDFVGASLPYVQEKIGALVYALKDLERYCKALDKSHKSLP